MYRYFSEHASEICTKSIQLISNVFESLGIQIATVIVFYFILDFFKSISTYNFQGYICTMSQRFYWSTFIHYNDQTNGYLGTSIVYESIL